MSSRRSKVEAGSIAWTISRRLGMVVVLALAFFLSATVTIYTLFRIGDTRVPDVVGQSEAEAQRLAEKAGLKVKIQRLSEPAAPPNTVFKTQPPPNSSVKKDSIVTIYVNSAPQTKSDSRVPGFWFLIPCFSLQ